MLAIAPMAKRLRHHVNPLKSEYATGDAAPVMLPEQGEVEVELGCADARFLFERAAAHPEITCIGVEIRRELVSDVNLRAAAAGLTNLRAVSANINVDLAAMFPLARLARVFILFPDPWFKRRHHKRRVMTPAVARTLAQQLAPDGLLYFASDVFDVALDAMAVLEDESDRGQLYNVAGPWSFLPHHPFAAKSLREVRSADRGLPIWRLAYRRSDAAGMTKTAAPPAPTVLG